MNIIRENVDALNAVLKVKVTEADYAIKVDGAIKNYQRKANVPGFRPGKVPTGMIKKMYGKSILADEINRILSDSLYKYIQENQIDVLGNPLPKDNGAIIDWENQTEFEFEYDMALAPQFDLNLGTDDKVEYLKITITQKEVDKAIEEMSRRYGKAEYPDVVEQNNLVFVELLPIVDGVANEASALRKSGVLNTETITDDTLMSLIVGKKKDDLVTIKPASFKDNAVDFERVLGEARNNSELMNSEWQLKIYGISRMSPAEVNQELYDKVYGPGSVSGIEEFRARISEELNIGYKQESDHHFKHQVDHLLVNKFNLQLPDAFLKRWIKAVNDKPLTDEQIEKEYPSYAEGLKLQLVEGKISKENNLVVSTNDLFEYTANIVKDNFRRYGRSEDAIEIESTVKRVLENKEEANKLSQKIFDERLSAYYMSKLGVTTKELNVDDFNTEVESHYKHHHHAH